MEELIIFLQKLSDQGKEVNFVDVQFWGEAVFYYDEELGGVLSE